MHLLKSRSKVSQFDQLSTFLGTDPYSSGLRPLQSPVSEGLRYPLPVVAQVPTWVTRPTPSTDLQLQFPNTAKFFNYVYTTIGTTLEEDRARNKLRNQQRRLLSNIAGHTRR